MSYLILSIMYGASLHYLWFMHTVDDKSHLTTAYDTCALTDSLSAASWLATESWTWWINEEASERLPARAIKIASLMQLQNNLCNYTNSINTEISYFNKYARTKKGNSKSKIKLMTCIKKPHINVDTKYYYCTCIMDWCNT